MTKINIYLIYMSFVNLASLPDNKPSSSSKPIAMTSRSQQYQIILAGSFIVAVSYGWGRYNYGLFLPYIEAEFQLNTVWQGLIASISYSGYLLTTLFASLFAARLGPKYMITIGGLLATSGLFLVYSADHLIWLTLGLTIAGISPGLCYTPLSEVSVRMFPANRRARAYSLMNTGTSFGVMAAGPVVIWYSDQWRQAWLIFALGALLITLWNTWLMPPKDPNLSIKKTSTNGLTLAGMASAWQKALRQADKNKQRLYVFSFFVGVSCSIYWTYAVITLSSSIQLDTEQLAIFWVLLGVFGVTGGIAGDLVRRLGFHMTLLLLSLLLSICHLIIYVQPSYHLALVSSAIFGGGFIALTALSGIWAVEAAPDNPARTFGMAFLSMSVGQFVAPFLMGIIASYSGLSFLFLLACGLLLGLNLCRPRSNFHTNG